MALSKSQPFSDKLAALERAFRKLPISQPGEPDALKYEMLLPGIARELASLSPRSLPNPNRRAIHRKLSKLKKCAEELQDGDNRFFNLPIDWRIPIISLGHLSLPANPEREVGAPKKVLGPRVARLVAQHFYGLTGLLPSDGIPLGGGPAGGPFVELLSEIYNILEVNDSATTQATAACANLRKSMTKSSSK